MTFTNVPSEYPIYWSSLVYTLGKLIACRCSEWRSYIANLMKKYFQWKVLFYYNCLITKVISVTIVNVTENVVEWNRNKILCFFISYSFYSFLTVKETLWNLSFLPSLVWNVFYFWHRPSNSISFLFSLFFSLFFSLCLHLLLHFVFLWFILCVLWSGNDILSYILKNRRTYTAEKTGINKIHRKIDAKQWHSSECENIFLFFMTQTSHSNLALKLILV